VIGATRATWGDVFAYERLMRARDVDNSVLVAPRGPNFLNLFKFKHLHWRVGATLGPRARGFSLTGPLA
jgi:hypothetical protein